MLFLETLGMVISNLEDFLKKKHCLQLNCKTFYIILQQKTGIWRSRRYTFRPRNEQKNSYKTSIKTEKT